MIITTYEQYKNLPHNRGRDSKLLHKEWLMEEAKLQMVYDCWTMPFQMQFNNNMTGIYGICGPTAGGSSDFTPIIPTTRVTYYTPNGMMAPAFLGYYTPDIDDLVNSYYIYV